MEAVLVALPVIACGVLMVACVRMLLGRHGGHAASDGDASESELARLKEEVARLQARLGESESRHG